MGFRSRVVSTTTNSKLREAHNEHFSTFTTDSEPRFQDNHTAVGRLVPAMLAITGRVTMLGLSRWAEKGGSYRTIQRFFYTVVP